MAYIENNTHEEGCVFCTKVTEPDSAGNLIIWRGSHAYIILNRYPYTSGHLMVVPYAHQSSLEALSAAARAEMMELATQALQVIQSEYRPQGFNIGFNLGAAAGAGIAEHVHMHVVPRWSGDTNFMSSLGQTRVLPETLEDTYIRIQRAWNTLFSSQSRSA